MSWLLGYFALGTIWAEIGLIGHWRKYNKMPSVSFYLFMLFAWPYLIYSWLKEMLFP